MRSKPRAHRSLRAIISSAVGALILVGCASNHWRPTHSEALLTLLEGIKSQDGEVRKTAARDYLSSHPWTPLGQVAGPVASRLVVALEDQQPEVRAAAARAIGSIGPNAKGVMPKVSALLKDREPRVRQEAAVALARLEARDEVPALVEALADVEIRDTALVALLHLDPPSIPPVELVRVLDADGDAWGELLWMPDLMRMLAEHQLDPVVSALGKTGGPVAHQIARLVGSDRARVRARATEVLKLLGPEAKGAVPELTNYLEDSRSRNAALDVLARIGPLATPAVKSIMRLLKVEQSSTRALAARALAAMGPPAVRAAPALVGLLRDRDEDVRMAAAAALGTIGDDGEVVITALRAASRDDSWRVREVAARSLLTFWK